MCRSDRFRILLGAAQVHVVKYLPSCASHANTLYLRGLEIIGRSQSQSQLRIQEPQEGRLAGKGEL